MKAYFGEFDSTLVDAGRPSQRIADTVFEGLGRNLTTVVAVGAAVGDVLRVVHRSGYQEGDQEPDKSILEGLVAFADQQVPPIGEGPEGFHGRMDFMRVGAEAGNVHGGVGAAQIYDVRLA